MPTASTDWQPLDVLSEAARDLLRPDGVAYRLLTPTSTGSPEARKRLQSLKPEHLFSAPVRSPDDARAALAGLWLYHDFLDDSHAISQGLHSPAGSFWHAIMHRREGDFSNAKYWYARCRNHPTLLWIAERGRIALRGETNVGQLERLVSAEWDVDGFVDVVEAIHKKRDDPMYGAAVRLQLAEWRVLFDHCVGAAAGAD